MHLLLLYTNFSSIHAPMMSWNWVDHNHKMTLGPPINASSCNMDAYHSGVDCPKFDHPRMRNWAYQCFHQPFHLFFLLCGYLGFLPNKSTIVGIFFILDKRTLRISLYLPSILYLGTSINFAILCIHITPSSMCCYMVAFKACICHSTS